MNRQNISTDQIQPNTQAEQDRLLEERLRQAGHDVEAMLELRSYLLSFGWRNLVHPCSPDRELAQLMSKGEWMAGEIVLRRMAMSQCHRNVAKLWRAEPRKISAIGTGYALSDDGLWRQHSWGVKTDGRVVETTVVRQKYFGLVLRDREAEQFARWNA